MSASHASYRPWVGLVLCALAACDSSRGGGAGPQPVELQVVAAATSVALGRSAQFAAQAVYADGSVEVVTEAVTWRSSDASIATVGNAIGSHGLLTTVSEGTVTIEAFDETSGMLGERSVSITTPDLVSIEVTPTSPSIALGTTQQFTATGIYSDSSTANLTSSVTWTSSAADVAAVASGGLANTSTVGTSLIAATDPTTGVSAAATLTVTAAVLVSIAITPNNTSIALGTTQQFVATGTFSDATTQDLSSEVVWDSSSTFVATVSNANPTPGLAAGNGLGTVDITAVHMASGVSAATALTVTAAALVSIAVTPSNPSIALGTTQQFTATGTYTDSSTQDLTDAVTWSSTAPAVASVSNLSGSEGLATSITLGSTTIGAVDPATSISDTATCTVTAAALVSIGVTPSNPSIALGTTQQFTATGTFTDSSTQDLTDAVTWSSSLTSTATISNAGGSEGLAASVAPGITTVTATHPGTAISSTTTLTVTAAALVSIAVTPSNPSIALGTTQPFTATGTYTDSSTQDLTDAVTWSSSSTGTATISNASSTEGLASSVAQGATTITATDPGTAIAGSTTLTVTAAALVSIAVTPTNPSIALGTTQQFTATGTYTDSSIQDLTDAVTWSSSATGTATISNASSTEGLASSVAQGATTITATDPGTAIASSTTLTVTAAALVSIAVTPGNSSIVLGGTRQLVATGTYTDSSTQDLTDAVTWSSSASGVATVSNAGGSEGLATSVAVGATTMTATDPGTAINGSTVLTVLAEITFRGAEQAGQGSGVQSISVVTPAASMAGDAMLATICVRPSNVTITPPSGWTLVRRVDNPAGLAAALAVYERFVSVSEPASHTWMLSASTGSVAGIATFAGVDTATAIDVHGGQTTPSAVTHDAPSVTTTVTRTMLMTLHCFASSETWLPPSGMTEAIDVASGIPSSAIGIAMSGNYELQLSAGATGLRTATANGSSDVGCGVSVALRPTP